jgi:hypothetical protein
MSMSHVGMIRTREKRRTQRRTCKTCPSATLPTTSPSWTDPGTNPVLHGERLVTDRLSHCTTLAYNIDMGQTLRGFGSLSDVFGEEEYPIHFLTMEKLSSSKNPHHVQSLLFCSQCQLWIRQLDMQGFFLQSVLLFVTVHVLTPSV